MGERVVEMTRIGSDLGLVNLQRSATHPPLPLGFVCGDGWLLSNHGPWKIIVEWAMIDRSLNYGRGSIRNFLQRIGPFESALDLGAGHGDDLITARLVRPSCRLIAIENHGPYLNELGARGVECHAVDIERDRLPFQDSSIDVVLANQVLEHTKDVFWIFHEISRVLRPGGHLILGVPNLASLHNRILLLMGRQPTVIKTDSGHVRGFTFPDLIDFLENCYPGGYELRKRSGANFYPLPPLLARPAARAFPSLAWGMMLHLQKCSPYSGGFARRPIDCGYETRFYTGGTI